MKQAVMRRVDFSFMEKRVGDGGILAHKQNRRTSLSCQKKGN